MRSHGICFSCCALSTLHLSLFFLLSLLDIVKWYCFGFYQLISTKQFEILLLMDLVCEFGLVLFYMYYVGLLPTLSIIILFAKSPFLLTSDLPIAHALALTLLGRSEYKWLYTSCKQNQRPDRRKFKPITLCKES